MWLNKLLWPFEKMFLLLGGFGCGLAAITAMDIAGLIVPGFHVLSYAVRWLGIWSVVGLVGYLVTLNIALWRGKIYERNKPFTLQASWVLGKDNDKCFIPEKPGTLGSTVCNDAQWNATNWATINASFPGGAPVRKANPFKAYK